MILTFKASTKIIAGTIVLSMFAPIVALAEDTGKVRPQGVGGANFCTNIDSHVLRLTNAMGSRDTVRTEKKGERDQKMDEKRGEIDKKRSGHRIDIDGNMAGRFAKLEARATTTEQQAAVQVFEGVVANALTLRRATVDLAVSEYRTAVDAKLASRRAQIDTATGAFKASVDAAVAKAKNDCVAGVDPKTVRESFLASLKLARETLKTATSEGKIKADIMALQKTRDKKISDASELFRTSFKSALDALKVALKSND